MALNNPPPIADADELVLDASGLACPLPVLKVKQQLQKMMTQKVREAAILDVIFSDRATLLELLILAEHTGCQVLEIDMRHRPYHMKLLIE